jgi:Domain of unknown function DUF11
MVFGKTKSLCSSPRPVRARLRLEGLEERITPGVIFSENFDGVAAGTLPAGWTASSPTGTPALWSTVNSGFAAPMPTSPNAAFAPGFGSISDIRLASPSILITGADPAITFQLNLDLESGFDGGQLWISINGGAFEEIVAAGGFFMSGGYNATIAPNFGSPMAGNPAWSGTTGGYATVTAVLPPAAMPGSTVRFRWRVATDNVNASSGMAIDNVQILIPPQSDVAIHVENGVAQVTAGAPVNYVVTLTNNGPNAISSAALVAVVSTNITSLTFTPSVGNFDLNTAVWSGLNLAAGQQATLTVHGIVAPGTDPTAGIGVSVFPPEGAADPNMDNNFHADADVVLQPGPGPGLQTFVTLLSFNPQVLRGYNFAFGDVTGDGVTDIIVAGGAGKPSMISVVDGQSGQLYGRQLAFAGFNGGVRVSVRDINGDGIGDIITSAAVPKRPRLKVFDGPTGGLILSI